MAATRLLVFFCLTITLTGTQVQAVRYSGSRRSIYKPPSETDVFDLENSCTPWIEEDFIPIIGRFKRQLFQDLRSSPQVRKIWNLQFDSLTIRRIFFKLGNRFQTNLGHPAPSALSNIVSKAASLFDPFTMPVFFEAAAITNAEVLLTHNKRADRGSSQRYVKLLSRELDKADLDDEESVWWSLLSAWAYYYRSFGFNLLELFDETFELFASSLIVLLERQNI